MENPEETYEDFREDLELKGSEIAVIHGQIFGDVFVRGKATLILHGIVRGNVWVENHGSAFIHGLVTGDITNNGGRVKHYGLIKGRINQLAGETIVHPRALICENKCL